MRARGCGAPAKLESIFCCPTILSLLLVLLHPLPLLLLLLLLLLSHTFECIRLSVSLRSLMLTMTASSRQQTSWLPAGQARSAPPPRARHPAPAHAQAREGSCHLQAAAWQVICR
jgi:hypothetical protein